LLGEVLLPAISPNGGAELWGCAGDRVHCRTIRECV
jgi:hypothetical protein